MGKLYPSCIVSNSDSIYFIAYALENAEELLVLVKSAPLPKGPDQISWTVVSTVSKQFIPFKLHGTYLLPGGIPSCVVDDNGVFAMGALVESQIQVIRYDPNGSQTWSLLDPITLDAKIPQSTFQLFFAKDATNDASTLYHLRLQPVTVVDYTTTTATPSLTVGGGTKGNINSTIIIGPMTDNNRTALESRSVVLSNVDGFPSGFTVGNNNLYVEYNVNPGYIDQREWSRYNKTMIAYPIASLITPGSSLSPVFSIPWNLGCFRRYQPASAASAGQLYSYCSVCNYQCYGGLQTVDDQFASFREVGGIPFDIDSLVVAPSQLGYRPTFAFIVTSGKTYTLKFDSINLYGSELQGIEVPGKIETPGYSECVNDSSWQYDQQRRSSIGQYFQRLTTSK
ncbi:hypothetical protein BGZ65_011598 [Modicella reniformis]|uniref:Uncharacterized protein n=1 Tax=Modicella reniformis TaxID=1440133 RepID=A0A9P6J7F2_9FUNG|nr:hypothetical protein BGZ65_011598 [Modicella reniformis]